MFTKLKYTFIGRPLKSLTEGEGGLLGKTQALAMLSSDALSSIAYGPEQSSLSWLVFLPLLFGGVSLSAFLSSCYLLV